MNSTKIKIKTLLKKKFHFAFIFLLPFILTEVSCKKLVETPPPSDQLTETNVFSTPATAIAVLNNLYVSMNAQGPIQGPTSISLLTGLTADELKLHSGITSSTPGEIVLHLIIASQ